MLYYINALLFVQTFSHEEKFDVSVFCCDEPTKLPSRKFDDLLLRKPCPDLVVYSGPCQCVSGASVTGLTPGEYVAVSANTHSEYDLSAEVVHMAELWTLKKWKERKDCDFKVSVWGFSLTPPPK